LVKRKKRRQKRGKPDIRKGKRRKKEAIGSTFGSNFVLVKVET